VAARDNIAEVRLDAAQHKLRYIWAPICLTVGAAIEAVMFSPTTMAWVLLPYFMWQFLHFQKQNLGMAAIAASAYGLRSLTRAERRSLTVAGIAGIGSVCIGLATLVKRPLPERPSNFTAIYVLALVFSLPIFIFKSPYAAVGGMTIAHGFQYLLLMGLIAAGPSRSSSRPVKLSVLCNIALLGGLALSAASHLHNSTPLLQLLFGAYLGVVMAHFVIDAGFWRMRDPFSRQFLARHVPYLVRGTSPLATDLPQMLSERPGPAIPELP
jgi:hypothetical protein